MPTFTNFEYYNLIMNYLQEGILFIDSKFSIAFSNKLASNILKFSLADLEFENIFNIFPSLELTFKSCLANSIDTKNFTMSYNNLNINLTLKIIYKENSFIGFLLIIKEENSLIMELTKLSSNAIYTFDSIIGESAQIKEVIENAKNIAKSPSTILITGESGSGKELLAQSIHNYSYRINEPFIAVNCGALPKSLIESELFGYEEGTFTGAKKGGKPGKFELANGGTIFLDEIGEMPLEMQVHLLRVIQEGVITRIGGKTEIPINVRIIAATNKDLKEEIKKGTFRHDLFYRLNVIPLHVPALKDRIGDVPILMDYFLKIKSEKLQKPIPKISNILFKKMISYCWPGNIRELENCIENIVNLNGSTSYEMNFDECTCLTHDNLGNLISHECIGDACTICNIQPSNQTIPKTLIELEIDAIKEALIYFNHNMTKTASSLGISRNALYNKIKRYGIN